MGNWKNFERWVGEHLFDGSKRNWGSGATNRGDDGKPRTGDVINPIWEVECKLYKTLAAPRWVYELAETVNTFEKLPVALLSRQGDEHETIAVIRYRDFLKIKNTLEKEYGVPLDPRDLDRMINPEVLYRKKYAIDRRNNKGMTPSNWWDKLREESDITGKVPVLVMRETGIVDNVGVGLHYTDLLVMLSKYLEVGGEWSWSSNLTPQRARNLLNKLNHLESATGEDGSIEYVLVEDNEENRNLLAPLISIKGIEKQNADGLIDLGDIGREYADAYIKSTMKFVTQAAYDKYMEG